MASGDLTVGNLAQLEMTTALQTVATISTSPASSALQVVAFVCNFTANDRLYDLKVRTAATANLNFIRGSNTAGVNGIGAGKTERINLGVLPTGAIIEAEADANNAVAITLTYAEAED